MAAVLPPDQGWWETLAFRLSGPENATVRALIAGNPHLPTAAFVTLARDADPEVLGVLSEHPALPADVALSLLRHTDAGEFLSQDWYERALDLPGLTPDDLCLLMGEVGWKCRTKALQHPQADLSVLEEYTRQDGDTEDVALAGELVQRFPMTTHPEVWKWLREDDRWLRALLASPLTPQAFLVLAAQDQTREGYMELVNGSTVYEDTEAICRHPNADETVFHVLLASDKFYDEDQGHDLRCLTLIRDHPRASATQRQRAAELIQRWAEADTEEDEE